MMITPRQNCLCEEVATQEAARTLGIPQPSFARPRNQTRKTKEACTCSTGGRPSAFNNLDNRLRLGADAWRYEPGEHQLGKAASDAADFDSDRALI